VKNDMLSNEEITTVFSNLETIALFNQHLLNNLDDRIKNLNNSTCVGDIFLELVPFLKMYGQYVCNHTNAIETLQDRLESRPKLRQFLEVML
jgi:hypothetical protein